MLTQPNIVEFLGGAYQPVPMNLWPWIGNQAAGEALVAQLKAIGIVDAAMVDAANPYINADGFMENDFPGLFSYPDPTQRFWMLTGTYTDPAGNKLRIGEFVGQLVDRLKCPVARLGDRPAPISVYPNGNKLPFPNGAQLGFNQPVASYVILCWLQKSAPTVASAPVA